MRRPLHALLLATAVFLLAAATATAGPPPRGTYECTIGGIYFGTVTIKKDNKYERNGQTGKFTSRGRKLKFTSGSFKGFKGRWHKSTSTNPAIFEIALRNPLDDFESIYCDK